MEVLALRLLLQYNLEPRFATMHSRIRIAKRSRDCAAIGDHHRLAGGVGGGALREGAPVGRAGRAEGGGGGADGGARSRGGAAAGAAARNSEAAKRTAGVGAVVGTAKGTKHAIKQSNQVLKRCLRGRGYRVLN